MFRGGFPIVILLILITSFATINYAFADIEISLTPEDKIHLKHSLIIDIIDTDATESISIDINVTSAGTVTDQETLNVDFDNSWGKYRLVIFTHSNVAPNPGNAVLEAKHGDIITVGYGTNSSKWKSVLYETNPTSEPTGNRWTFATNLQPGCLDVDEDAVCDVWEQGSTLRIEDSSVIGSYTFDCLPGGGCDNSTKDIFVEVDWMKSHQPDPKAIQEIINAFTNETNHEKIRLHVQIDTEPAIGHLSSLAFPGDDNGPKGFDQLKADQFGTAMERNDTGTDWSEIKKLKHQVFHYSLFAHKILDDNYQTGIGEITGNDFLVTLGKYTGRTGSTDQQSGTFMHELGHNLGLDHGGSDNVQNKPNLFSIMTYARQFADIDSDRKLDFSNLALGHPHTNPPRADVDVNGLNETSVKGFGQGMILYEGHEDEFIIFSCPDGQVAPVMYKTGKQGGVDWDCDGNSTEKGKFPLNINNLPTDPTPPLERLDGHNDWGSLNFAFSSNIGNYADGRERITSDGKELTFEKTTLNRISNLLSLYRQIEMFNEHDFSSGFPSDNKIKVTSTDSLIINNQFNLMPEPKKDSIKIEVSMKELSIPNAFADHVTASISLPVGSGAPGCEEFDECYIPNTVTIDVGGEVIWSNDDTAAHTVTSGSAADGPSGVFDSSLFFAGETYSVVFDEKGEYPYYCVVHPWMTGLVIVNSGHALDIEDKVVIGGTDDDSKDDDSKVDENETKSYKTSFKEAVYDAIKLINIHDIEETQNAVHVIDISLQKSLSPENYEKIKPITSNLVNTYEKALGFGTVSTDEPLNEPIIPLTIIDEMIGGVEKFVEKSVSSGVECGVPYEIVDNVCECPSGLIENAEPDCIDVFIDETTVLSPVKQIKLEIFAEDVVCNEGFNLILDTVHDRPACVENDSVTKLVKRGWVKP